MRWLTDTVFCVVSLSQAAVKNTIDKRTYHKYLDIQFVDQFGMTENENPLDQENFPWYSLFGLLHAGMRREIVHWHIRGNPLFQFLNVLDQQVCVK